jgi:hypothetical protein
MMTRRAHFADHLRLDVDGIALRLANGQDSTVLYELLVLFFVGLGYDSLTFGGLHVYQDKVYAHL